MPSESSPNSPEPEPHVGVDLTVRLTCYTTTTTTTGKKITKRVTKDNKTKELRHIFQSTKENYVLLLKKILLKHGVTTKLDVTPRRRYRIKIQVPPAKQSEACDIEKYHEYEDVVTKLLERRPTKAIMVYVDMKDVEKAAAMKLAEDDEGEGSEGDGNEEPPAIEDDAETRVMSAKEAELARFRGLLEQEHGNDHDKSYTYVCPVTGESVPLTPLMMKEWARALHDGQTTVKTPPNTQNFDPTTRQSSLLSVARSRIGRLRSDSSSDVSVSAPSSASAPDALAQVASIISSVVTLARPAPHSPATPKRSRKITAPSPGLVSAYNTPSKLPRFLEYAENKLGVRNALSFEDSLKDEGFGPDILHRVDDETLLGIGFSRGDVIRIKDNSLKWWNSSEGGKRSREEHEAISGPPRTPPNKKLRFEKRFHGGSGAASCWGPKLVGGRKPADADYDWWFFCPARNMMTPVPEGFVPQVEGEEERNGWDD